MNNTNPEEPHELPRGVIEAGIARAEDEANQVAIDSSRPDDGDSATMSVDAMMPYDAEKGGRLENVTRKIKNIGRSALEQLPFGGSVSWNPEQGDTETKDKEE